VSAFIPFTIGNTDTCDYYLANIPEDRRVCVYRIGPSTYRVEVFKLSPYEVLHSEEFKARGMKKALQETQRILTDNCYVEG